MTNVYALYNSSSTPPTPWSRVTTYNDRFLRFGPAVTTGGNTSHTHTVNSYTCGDAFDVNFKFNTGNYILKSISGGKHNHGTSGLSFSSADNNPPFYTLSLISTSIANFFNSGAGGRRLYQNFVCMAAQTISASGYSRFTSLDNKLVKLSSTPGSTGGSSNHSHMISGSLDEYSGISSTSEAGSAFLSTAVSGNYKHTHSVSASVSGTAIPAYTQLRFYQVTSASVSVPVGVVLLVDGSIAGYTEFLEVQNYSNYAMGGDVNPTTGGSNVHNHGTGGNITSGTSANPTYGKTEATASGITASHTHTITVSLDNTDVSHEPPYVTLIPVRVIKEINPLSTKTKTYTMNTLLRKRMTKTYAADVCISAPGSKYYSADVLIHKKNITKTYTMHTYLQKFFTKTYTTKTIIKRTDIRNTYKMSLAPLFMQGARYSLSIKIVPPIMKPGPVIDTLINSYVHQINKLYQKIHSASGALTLEYAVGEDLERKWGKVYNLPRKPGETDASYRSRLMTYQSAMLGSGNIVTLKDILNGVTGGDSVYFRILPGRLCIYFNKDEQRRRAKAISDALTDILQQSVAAGISAEIYYNYCDYMMEMILLKRNAPAYYYLSTSMSRRLLKTYTLGTALVLKQFKTYTLRVALLRRCAISYSEKMLLKATVLENYQLDTMIRKTFSSTYEADTIIRNPRAKITYSADTLVLRTFSIMYVTDVMLKAAYVRVVKMATVIKKINSAGYNMDIKIIGG